MYSHSPLAQWISSLYIGLPFFNTMSQNHITSDGIPGQGHLDESLPNTMGQYHGGYPWFCTLWALFLIRYLARYYPCAYATSPRQIRVCLETYSFHHRFSTCWIPFFIAFYTHCRYISFSSSRHILSSTTSSSRLPSSSSSGLPFKDNTLHHIANKSWLISR